METNKEIRVRFAPSPTGGLHLGGVRTVLFNYLFTKKHGGKFILRIEDTDQTRFVEGAEQYIYDCLAWCGLTPDESPVVGGPHAPYKQSERKPIYKQYAEQLISSGHAYYAFDTPEALEKMRETLKEQGSDSLQYDYKVRNKMDNSLNISKEELEKRLAAGEPYVIRIKVEPGEILSFDDMVRGKVEMDTSFVDDKVLLKADGMPTYHLAVVVDDYLMNITHAFRGEEWLPSAPIHLLLWKHLFGLDKMPVWAHLPLILKPDGNGKLSKRDGERLGFPVYAMNWTDPVQNVTTPGFRETGFLPEAFINMLAMLGWNDGTEQEIFSMEELLKAFSMERVHKAGAKFNYEKALWFNHEWIKKLPASHYADDVIAHMNKAGLNVEKNEKTLHILDAVKERCHLLTDFVEHAGYLFKDPEVEDPSIIQQKWDDQKAQFFSALIQQIRTQFTEDATALEHNAKQLAADIGIKFGEVQMMTRIMLVGKKAGIGVFQIIALIGAEAACRRIEKAISKHIK